MKTMMAFLVVCIVLGLYTPRRARLGVVVVTLAVGMVLFFFLKPQHM